MVAGWLIFLLIHFTLMRSDMILFYYIMFSVIIFLLAVRFRIVVMGPPYSLQLTWYLSYLRISLCIASYPSKYVLYSTYFPLCLVFAPNCYLTCYVLFSYMFASIPNYLFFMLVLSLKIGLSVSSEYHFVLIKHFSPYIS